MQKFLAFGLSRKIRPESFTLLKQTVHRLVWATERDEEALKWAVKSEQYM